MSLILSDGERVIKSWDYGVQQDSEKSVTKNVTVTNKRLVCSAENERYITRYETGISNILSVSSGYSATKSKRKLYVILSIVMALLTAICLAVALITKIYYIAIGAVVFVALMIVFLVKMSRERSVVTFYLNVRTKGASEEAVSIGTSSAHNEFGEMWYVAIDEEVSREIVDTIGALLLR